MADIRAMLRAERAARAPTKTKPSFRDSEASQAQTKRKRKATETDDSTRKRVAFDLPPSEPAIREPASLGAPTKIPTIAGAVAVPASSQQATLDAKPLQDGDAAKTSTIDEDEWAAFEREVAAPTHNQPSNVLDAINAANSISSAPLTAEELAARAREEASEQRSRRDAEIEVEKEDAEEALAQEFDEMEALELRVQKLKDRREQLRQRSRTTDLEQEAKTASYEDNTGTSPSQEGPGHAEARDAKYDKEEDVNTDEMEDDEDNYDEEDDLTFHIRKT